MTTAVSLSAECGAGALNAKATVSATFPFHRDTEIFSFVCCRHSPRTAKPSAFRAGRDENSLCKSGYLRRVQKYVCSRPSTRSSAPRPAGVRAQAVSPDGKLIDDFRLSRRRSIYTCNALPGGDISDTYRRAYRQQFRRYAKASGRAAACGTQRDALHAVHLPVNPSSVTGSTMQLNDSTPVPPAGLLSMATGATGARRRCHPREQPPPTGKPLGNVPKMGRKRRATPSTPPIAPRPPARALTAKERANILRWFNLMMEHQDVDGASDDAGTG